MIAAVPERFAVYANNMVFESTLKCEHHSLIAWTETIDWG